MELGKLVIFIMWILFSPIIIGTPDDDQGHGEKGLVAIIALGLYFGVAYLIYTW